MITQEEKQRLQERFANNPGILFETLANTTSATPSELIECLPQSMWKKVSGESFEKILTSITTWGQLTTIVHTDDLIMEYSGHFPEGSISHGFYNLSKVEGEGLHGHLRYKNCQNIYFVTRPFKGSETKSILFTNQEGSIMFKVFLGRDEQHQILKDQIQLFEELQKEFI